MLNLGRRQVRAVGVYGVPLVGVDARGTLGRCLAVGKVTWHGIVAAGIVAALDPPYVRRRGLRRVRFAYPYVRHPSPPLVVGLAYAHCFGPPAQLFEEPGYVVPNLAPTAKAPPAGPDQTYQLVALVYWYQKVVAGSPSPIDQERLHVSLHVLQ